MDAADSKDKFSPENLLYDGASEIVAAEARQLTAWRGQEPQVGLALSGGGIRSATYCLGVLQALAYRRALPQVDYLSTVSGGGYIGASLSYLLHQSAQDAAGSDATDTTEFDVSRENFPYASYPMVGMGAAPGVSRGQASASSHAQQRQHENFKGRLLRRLRQSANYLLPGDGITWLSLVGVVVRNLANSLLVHVALLVLLFEALFLSGWFVFKTYPVKPVVAAADAWTFPASNHFLHAAGWVLVTYGLLSMLYTVFTRAFNHLEQDGQRSSYWLRRGYETVVHYLLVAAITLLVVGGLPWMHELLAGLHLTQFQGWLKLLDKQDKSNPVATGVVATLIGIFGNVWGLLQARSGKQQRIPLGLVLGLASALLAFGLLLLVYMLTGWLHANPPVWGDAVILLVAAGTLLLLGWVPEANYVSLHRFYRDRLMDLFLPDLQVVRDNMLASEQQPMSQWSRFMGRFRVLYRRSMGMQPGDATRLGDLCQMPGDGMCAKPLLRGPYPIFNANVVLTASHHPRYRPRGGDNFIFSPLFCGSRATGWMPTDRRPGSGFTLATAMAISGAAVNPNAGPDGQGITRQPILSVLMGLLNLRLGYWAQNPRYATEASSTRQGFQWIKPNQLYPGLFESFGRFNLNEYARYSLLTDGGHFENLGLYELVRRRLKLIIACDATADPDFKFTDLANAIQKVRADFGAIIDIDDAQLATLMPNSQNPGSKAHGAPAGAQRGYLIVPIRYATRPDPSDRGREVGTLILLKATAFQGLPADVFSYRRDHPEFPNQSTLDQFYGEKQFDSYRELGYVTAFEMLREVQDGAREPDDEYQTAKGYRAPAKRQVARLLFGAPEAPASNASGRDGAGTDRPGAQAMAMAL